MSCRTAISQTHIPCSAPVRRICPDRKCRLDCRHANVAGDADGDDRGRDHDLCDDAEERRGDDTPPLIRHDRGRPVNP
jgi:hypothetical protein